MIERTVIEGRRATVSYLRGFQPVSAEEATSVKVLFDDGEERFGVAAPTTKAEPTPFDDDPSPERFIEEGEGLIVERPDDTRKYDPNQARDAQGQWTEVGATAVKVSQLSTPESLEVLNVKNYTANGHLFINGALRGQGPNIESYRSQIAHLDKFAERGVIEEDGFAYRVVNGSGAGGRIMRDLKPGDTLVDLGFTSVALDRGGIDRFAHKRLSGHRLMKIAVSKGQKVGPVMFHSMIPEEAEVIIPRGSRLRFDSASGTTLNFTLLETGVEKFDPDQPRDDHGRWSVDGSADWPREDDGSAKAGDTVLVYRLGSETGDIAGKNGGNANAVASHMVRTSDFDRPQPAGGSGDTVSVYSVRLTADPTQYARSNVGSRTTGDTVGRLVQTWTNGDKAVTYSFPEGGKGYESTLLARVPLSAVGVELLRLGDFHSADEAGTLNTVTAIRRVLGVTKYDPNQARDRVGRWADQGLTEAPSNRADWPEHIQALTLPPAWTGVMINPNPDADLLAVGKDAKGRDQYVYSARYAQSQAAAKFARTRELMEKFDRIGKQNVDNAAKGGALVREHAEVMSLIMATGIRPGSDRDTGADKQAYGATTLLGKHVVVSGKETALRFTGKKGVALDIPVTDRKIAQMLRGRAEASGADGRLFPNVNQPSLLEYSHSLDGGGFKTKDFRTALGTKTALAEIARLPAPTSPRAYKRAVSSVGKAVSKVLGNTPTVALQAYIDPSVFGGWRAQAGV